MKLAFVDPTAWAYDLDSPYQIPMGGSQSALCYLAEELVRLGHTIFLLNRIPEAKLSRQVACLPLTVEALQTIAALPVDGVIVLSASDVGRKIRPFLGESIPIIFWNQHAADQPDLRFLQEPDGVPAYNAFVFVSRWQAQQVQQAFGIDPALSTVIGNAIAPCFANGFPNEPSLPSPSILSQKGSQPTLVYTSTPFRGLDLLLEAFPLIREAIPAVRLQVFSSLQVYQITGDQDSHQALYRRCREMEGVEYVGSLPQPDLVKTLQSATLFSYPNTFPETFCISALEAMACGCQVVTSDLGALPDTTAGFARLIPIRQTASLVTRQVELTPDERSTYLHQFVAETIAVLNRIQSAPEGVEAQLRRQVDYVNQYCTWPVRAQEWVAWLRSLGLKE